MPFSDIETDDFLIKKTIPISHRDINSQKLTRRMKRKAMLFNTTLDKLGSYFVQYTPVYACMPTLMHSLFINRDVPEVIEVQSDVAVQEYRDSPAEGLQLDDHHRYEMNLESDLHPNTSKNRYLLGRNNSGNQESLDNQYGSSPIYSTESPSSDDHLSNSIDATVADKYVKIAQYEFFVNFLQTSINSIGKCYLCSFSKDGKL